MSSSRERRLNKLVGQDMGAVLRTARDELAALQRTERRKGEVDGNGRERQLDVPVLLVEDIAGRWVASTTTELWPEFKGLRAMGATERLAIAELRQGIREAAHRDRFANEDSARYIAAKAKIYSVGSVAYSRIITTVK